MASALDRLEAFTDQAEDVAARFNEGVVDAVERLAWWTDRSAVRPLHAAGRLAGVVAHVAVAVLRVAVFYVPAIALGLGGAAAENGWMSGAAVVYALAVTVAGLTYIRRGRGPAE